MTTPRTGEEIRRRHNSSHDTTGDYESSGNYPWGQVNENAAIHANRRREKRTAERSRKLFEEYAKKRLREKQERIRRRVELGGAVNDVKTGDAER